MTFSDLNNQKCFNKGLRNHLDYKRESLLSLLIMFMWWKSNNGLNRRPSDVSSKGLDNNRNGPSQNRFEFWRQNCIIKMWPITRATHSFEVKQDTQQIFARSRVVVQTRNCNSGLLHDHLRGHTENRSQIKTQPAVPQNERWTSHQTQIKM